MYNDNISLHSICLCMHVAKTIRLSVVRYAWWQFYMSFQLFKFSFYIDSFCLHRTEHGTVHTIKMIKQPITMTTLQFCTGIKSSITMNITYVVSIFFFSSLDWKVFVSSISLDKQIRKCQYFFYVSNRLCSTHFFCWRKILFCVGWLFKFIHLDHFLFNAYA